MDWYPPQIFLANLDAANQPIAAYYANQSMFFGGSLLSPKAVVEAAPSFLLPTTR
jgi:hypothetical protein